jgi:hypothetical protein
VTAIVGLDVAAPVEAWERVGLRVEDGVTWVGGVALRFVESSASASGVTGWTLLASAQRPTKIDGLRTQHTDDDAVESWTHPMGATGFDHVVVMTSSIERTCGAIESVTGEPLKRVRESGAVRQGFHRLGPVVVEVVESPRVTDDHASFWGLVLVVDDIHEAAGRLGPEVLSRPKTAVQPGRLIASFRDDAGLGLPVALMSL